MAYDFDRVIERRHTESSKWRKYGEDVIPLWVADMDFASPAPVIRALRERVEHGVFGYGYTLERSPLHDLFADRLQKLYGWRVEPDAVVLIPGVIPGFNVACRALTAAEDGVLLKVPLYPPLLRVPGNVGIMMDAADLARSESGRYEIDFDALERAITPRTRVLLLCNPHNPVGRAWRLEELLRYLGANRDFLVDYVRRRLAGVAVAPPDATYLAWLDCRDAAIPGGDPFTFFLETARVALNDGTAFGRSGQGFVRLNFGCPRTILTEGLDRMRAALAALR